jgi:hypothetical protein
VCLTPRACFQNLKGALSQYLEGSRVCYYIKDGAIDIVCGNHRVHGKLELLAECNAAAAADAPIPAPDMRLDVVKLHSDITRQDALALAMCTFGAALHACMFACMLEDGALT